MQQLTPGTSNAVLLSTNFCAKTKETPVYQLLPAHLRIFYFELLLLSLSSSCILCTTVDVIKINTNIEQKYGTPIYRHAYTTACLLKDYSQPILTYYRLILLFDL